MGHGPSSFKESDVRRALRAIEAAGKKVASVEIEDGRIKITIKNGNGADDNIDDTANTNPWDKVDLK
jgi:hypothetical protein